ncbi:10179_t:CDS:2, partial [Racocetra persica]
EQYEYECGKRGTIPSFQMVSFIPAEKRLELWSLGMIKECPQLLAVLQIIATARSFSPTIANSLRGGQNEHPVLY